MATITATATDFGGLNFQQLEAVIEENLVAAEHHFARALLAVDQVRQRALWKPRYRSLPDYLQQRFACHSRQRAHQLINQLEVCLDVVDLQELQAASTMVDAVPMIPPERQTRALAELPHAEDRRQAYQGATRAAAAEGLPAPRQRHVEAAVDRLKPNTAIEDPEERRRADEQAIDEWIEEEELQHRQHRPRVERFKAWAAKQSGLVKRTRDRGELAEMRRVVLQLVHQVDQAAAAPKRAKEKC